MNVFKNLSLKTFAKVLLPRVGYENKKSHVRVKYNHHNTPSEFWENFLQLHCMRIYVPFFGIRQANPRTILD